MAEEVESHGRRGPRRGWRRNGATCRGADRDTPNGAQGRRLVREQLATARTLVVNTRKYDIHRRYVAHVVYAFNKRGIEHTFLKGRYLNQELMDKGFAKVV